MDSYLSQATLKPTHSGRLEKWLGADAVGRLSDAMRDFYYPIAVHGVPGDVYAMPGGDFAGRIRSGSEMSAMDAALDRLARERRQLAATVAAHRIAGGHGHVRGIDKRQHAFASLSALIAAATTGGKNQTSMFNKTGVAGTAVGGCIDLWTLGAWPPAGAAGSAAPGGKAWSNLDAGAFTFVNSQTANASHFTTGYATASVAGNSLLLYDRTFSVAKTMNSTAAESVTGVPTRYQSTSNTSAAYCGGTFMFTSVPTTVLPATAHNWLTCSYSNQAGAGGNVSFPSMSGISACAKNQLDMTLGNWFFPLATGDAGILDINQMQCSALVATGTIDFVLGHPIAFLPCPIANMICTQDGINTAFNLEFIMDGACLALLEMPKPAASITTYSGSVTLVSE